MSKSQSPKPVQMVKITIELSRHAHDFPAYMFPWLDELKEKAMEETSVDKFVVEGFPSPYDFIG